VGWVSDLFESDDVHEIGIYVFFGDMFVAPAAYLLGDTQQPARPHLPKPGTDRAGDLLRRMYQVVEGWLGDDPGTVDAVVTAHARRLGKRVVFEHICWHPSTAGP
jgi:hypothetical protein